MSALLSLCLLVGCNTTQPPTSIHLPMTAKPARRVAITPSDGAIFHAGVNEHLLFEDRHAKNVGDILTINIVESTSGSRNSSDGTTTKKGAVAATPQVTVGPLSRVLLKAFSINSNSNNSTANTGSGAATESLTGTIAVTVIQVLPNGNLVVSGEKQVALNNSNEFIRFSGVVNPLNIDHLNEVPSNQVADAHLEYKNAGEMNQVINDAKSLGFLGRFFLSVLPF
ncbi:MAG: flagellar basal body L-ring protein FlgH [Gallionella sp.]